MEHNFFSLFKVMETPLPHGFPLRNNVVRELKSQGGEAEVIFAFPSILFFLRRDFM